MSTHWTLGDDWTQLRAEQCSTLLADMCYGINQRQAMAGLSVSSWSGGAIPKYPTPGNFTSRRFDAAGGLINQIDVAIDHLTANSTWYTDNTFATQLFHASGAYSTIKRIQDLSSWQALKAVFDSLKYLRILTTNPSMAYTGTGYYINSGTGDPWNNAYAAGIKSISGTGPLSMGWGVTMPTPFFIGRIDKSITYTLPTPATPLTGAGIVFRNFQCNISYGVTSALPCGFSATETIAQGTNNMAIAPFSGNTPISYLTPWYDAGAGPTLAFVAGAPPASNPFSGVGAFSAFCGINTLYLRTDYDVSPALLKG